MEVKGKGGVPDSGLGVKLCKVVEVIRSDYFPKHAWEYTNTFLFSMSLLIARVHKDHVWTNIWSKV